MSDSTLHIGTLAMNNIVNDSNKYSEQKEWVKDIAKDISPKKDSYERITEPLQYVCECYQNYSVVTGMPKSTFGDSFGYEMQKNVSNYMKDFYAGKVSQEELDSYFEECCTSMRIYRTQQHQTTGASEADNKKIVSEMYEIFAKENARAARQVNYQEGKTLNQSMYQDNRSDWTYYNADYYYKCSETNAALRESVQKMAEKWELDNIDCQAIEDNSCYTIDGGFDFNSGWNFSFRNQAGRSSIATEDSIPPEGFKIFFKEQVTEYTENNEFDGYLKIVLGKEEYELNVPFQTLRTGPEGEIQNVWDLMKERLTESKDNTGVKDFLSNLSVFTRWYSYQTGMNNRVGDYEWQAE